ncbi:peptidoglycan-binding protein [Streptomyces sp. NPDC058656]|uniref:peptidoglycan-binding domain-containing protein n=1 Tax=unclassified Streptomyces TaxID=2593676 RepID=UPI003653697D
MRKIKRPGATLMALALAAVVTPVASVALATPAAAAASCTGNSTKVKGSLIFTLPSVGNGSGNLECVMGIGNQGAAVRNLQATLNVCYGAGLAVDGEYGRLTAAAVRSAQQAHGIADDGVYGPQTRRTIRWVADNGGAGVCRVYGA